MLTRRDVRRTPKLLFYGTSMLSFVPLTFNSIAYAFPNDLLEQERLALQGEILRQLFGEKLFFSPLIKSMPPRAILDIATGLGDWAIQMGDLFPDSQVIGTDLSPIQPVDVPPNVNFYVEDSCVPSSLLLLS